MSWTATLKSVTLDPTTQNSISVIAFSNGTITLPDDTELGLDQAGLSAYCQQKINNLTHVDSMAAYVAANPVGPVVAPAGPTPPTQAQIDFVNFSKWMQLTIALNAAKSLGWITGGEQVVLDAKTKVLALATVNIPKLFN